MAKFNRDEKYQGHQNEEIISLTQSLNDLEAEKRRIEGDIKEIRENCDHEFQLWSVGMYDDSYYCKHCGEEIWN